jgi:hypothetical protein
MIGLVEEMFQAGGLRAAFVKWGRWDSNPGPTD